MSAPANDPSVAPMLDEVGKRIGAVVERIASGDDAGAARQFVETVALGPGTWDQLSPDLQQAFITNAPTFLDEAHDPEQLAFDIAWIGAFHRPSLLTTGDQSLPTFALRALLAIWPRLADQGSARHNRPTPVFQYQNAAGARGSG